MEFLTPADEPADLPRVALLRDDPAGAHRELLQLATALTRAGAQHEILELIADVTPTLLYADRVSIALVEDHDEPLLHVVALSGRDGAFASGDRVPMANTLAGEAIEQRCTITTDLRRTHCVEAHLLPPHGAHHTINAPLISASRCYGTLNASYATAPQPDEVEVMAQLAVLTASQLDRVEAHDALEREVEARVAQTERLASLHNIEAQLSRAASLDDVVEILSTSITAVVPVARVSYAHVGPNRGESTLYGIHGMEGLEAGTVLTLDEEAFEARFTANKSYYNSDHRQSEEEVHARLLEAGIESSMNIGIYQDDHPVGTLNVGLEATNGLSTADRAILLTLASFMGNTLERIEAHTRLAFEAHHDNLTGLIRRQIFDERLDVELEELRASGAVSAVCFIDVDRFKLVNDTAGHEAGDVVLRQATERLLSWLTPDDVLSRVGGDEFVMILRGRDRHAYEPLCHEIIEAIAAQPFVAGDRVISSTISVGLALVDAATSSPRDAMTAADAACYVAKANGGNRVSIASSVDDEQHARRTAGTLLLRLQHAIDNHDLQLHGQPIRAIGAAGTEAVEVLVRMNDDRRGLLQPGRFIPVAERYGMIGELDSWVVASTLRMASRSAAQNGLDDRMLFINLSPSSITSDGFVDRIRSCIHDGEVDPARICFEITETGTMKNFEAAVAFVETLKREGVRFALDDFGVGLSSLSHLRLLPVDYLKIDGSLVRGIESSPLNATMVSSIKAMADALGVSTIAEHTENRAALDALAQLGIQSAQGYFLGHPAPLERVLGIGHEEPALRIAPDVAVPITPR